LANERFTTPIGIASWANIRREEEYQGKPTGYKSITVKFPLEVTQKLLEQLETTYNEIKKYAPCFKGAKPAKGSKPNFGTKLDKDGDIVFKFRTKSQGKNPRTGETWDKTINVFDSAGKPVLVEIGNGSSVQVAYEIGPKFVDGTKYGLNLYLSAVMVKNLVQYQPGQVSAESFGFDIEDAPEGSEFDSEGFDSEDQSGDVSEEF
jgi:hypothetical protein